MRSLLFRSRGLCVTTASAAALIAAGSANADVRIAFTGMNMIYDGNSLFDGGGSAGGNVNPAEADPLVTVDFFNDDSHVGALTSDISLDFLIDGITGIPSAPNANYTTNGTPDTGYFDLLIGTAPLATSGLLLDIQSVSVTYVDIGGIVEFTFGGVIASIVDQSLPFGLQIADPVTVSISAQVMPNSLNIDGDTIYGFEAFGTGEYRAAAIPTPGAAALFGVGALATIRRRAR